MEVKNQNYFLLHCFGFWVYLTYQGGAGERQEQLLAGSVSSPPGWDTTHSPTVRHPSLALPGGTAVHPPLDMRKPPTATAYVTLSFGYTAMDCIVYYCILLHLSIMQYTHI